MNSIMSIWGVGGILMIWCKGRRRSRERTKLQGAKNTKFTKLQAEELPTREKLWI
jgi:hypothetical protein